MTAANSSTRRIVRIEVPSARADEAAEALLELERRTREEPGCREFAFYRALGAPADFALIEEFADAASLDAHMAAPHTRAFFARGLVASVRPA